MATRSGGGGVAQVGRLQEARHSLELELGFPVAASIGSDMRLLAYPVTPEDREKLKAYPNWAGFVVEARETPKAL